MLSDAMSNTATEQSNHSWEQASSMALKRVDALIARLPEDLRREASELECEFLRRCDDPNAQDTMGGYSRSAHRIRLYLDAIDDYCRLNGLDYCSQVETTFLHELGHHLGLEEDGLEKRGL